MENDEYALMRRIADGDGGAFADFAARYGNDLMRMCLRQARDAESARDLNQEVLVKVWRGAAAFDGRASLRTWLYRVVARAAIDEHRRMERVPAPTGALPEPPPGWGSLEDAVAGQEELRWALAQIPAPFRTVLILSDICDLSDQDVARKCRIAPVTVRTRLHRARTALRGILAAA